MPTPDDLKAAPAAKLENTTTHQDFATQVAGAARAMGQVEGQKYNPVPWTKEDTDQLLVYMRDTETVEELAIKMKRDVYDVLSKMKDMSYKKKEYNELRRTLR